MAVSRYARRMRWPNRTNQPEISSVGRQFEGATSPPHDVATYIETLQQTHSAPGVKQQLAAVRMLFDWLRSARLVARSGHHVLDVAPVNDQLFTSGNGDYRNQSSGAATTVCAGL